MITLHPFVDGNKRTAYATTNVFLKLNGYNLLVNGEDAVKLIIEIAGGRHNEADVREWIRKHIRRKGR